METQVVFLDRDGVINKQPPPHRYLTRWEDFSYLPGAKKAMKRLTDAGYRLVVVSNQRGIARGMVSVAAVEDMNRKLIEDAAGAGGKIDAVYYCPHDICDNCSCRKPRTGLLKRAEEDFKAAGFKIDKKNSWMIGDFLSDVQAGIRYGVNTIHIRFDWVDPLEGSLQEGKEDLLHLRAGSLLEAADLILEQKSIGAAPGITRACAI